MQGLKPIVPRRASWPGSAPYLLALPLMAFLAIAFVLPVARMMLLSIVPDTQGQFVTFERFAAIFGDPYDRALMLRTLRVGVAVTALSLVMAYPVALLMRNLTSRWQSVLVLIMVSPLLTSVVVRSLAWVVLLSRQGVLNQGLRALGLPDLLLMYSETGVVIALTHVFFGYMVVSLLTVLRRIDDNLYAAAFNLGASRLRVFREITLPLSLPGVLTGCVLVFTLSASAYATPALVGGSRNAMLAMEVYNLAILQLAWGDAAAVATILLALIVAVVVLATWVAEGGKRKVIFQ
jgi:putative spermidine/putrescine transport system permease protein